MMSTSNHILKYRKSKELQKQLQSNPVDNLEHLTSMLETRTLTEKEINTLLTTELGSIREKLMTLQKPPALRNLFALSANRTSHWFEHMEMCKRIWRELSEEQRQRFITEVERLKFDFHMKIASLTEQERVALENLCNAKEEQRHERRLVSKYGRPKKPLSALQLFVETVSGRSYRQRTMLGTKQWQSMTETEKKPFYERAKAARKKYNVDLEKWKRNAHSQYLELRPAIVIASKEDTMKLSEIKLMSQKEAFEERMGPVFGRLERMTEADREIYVAKCRKLLSNESPTKDKLFALLKHLPSAQTLFSKTLNQTSGSSAERLKNCLAKWEQLNDKQKQKYTTEVMCLKSKRFAEIAALSDEECVALKYLFEDVNKKKQAKDATKLASDKWKTMIPDEKRPFYERSKTEYEKYKADLKLWKADMIAKGQAEVLARIESMLPRHLRESTKESASSKQRFRDAFELFKWENKEKIKSQMSDHSKPDDRFKLAASMWDALSPKDREDYVAKFRDWSSKHNSTSENSSLFEEFAHKPASWFEHKSTCLDQFEQISADQVQKLISEAERLRSEHIAKVAALTKELRDETALRGQYCSNDCKKIFQ